MRECDSSSRQATAASDDLVGAAFDALPAQVAVVDADGVILETNRAWEEFGVDNGIQGPPDTVGENYLALCEGADDETATAAAAGIRAVLAGERDEFALEYPCHSPDERRWFLMRAIPLDGADRRALVMHVDVTERVEAERRVRAKNETLTTVTNVLSHDLRNPLNVALGRADHLVRQPDAGAEVVADQARAVVDSLQRMDAIVDDALVVAGEAERVDPERVTLGDVAHDAWAQVPTGDATLRVVDEATLLADASLLAQLFENLFRNAVEHGSTSPGSPSTRDPPEELTVTVGATPDGFFVADDGPGVPEGDRERVFETGYSTESDDGGTGMGLAIVARVAEAHGWDVRVADPADSLADGADGACFVVTGVDVEC